MRVHAHKLALGSLARMRAMQCTRARVVFCVQCTRTFYVCVRQPNSGLEQYSGVFPHNNDTY